MTDTPFQKAGFKLDDVFRVKTQYILGRLLPDHLGLDETSRFTVTADAGNDYLSFSLISGAGHCPFFPLSLTCIDLAPEPKQEVPEILIEVLRDMLADPDGVLERWEVDLGIKWVRAKSRSGLVYFADTFPRSVRRKQQRITATCMDGTVVSWPEPMREAPEKGTEYWIPWRAVSEATNHYWQEAAWEIPWLKAGVCHTAEANAIEHAEAMATLSKGGKNDR